MIDEPDRGGFDETGDANAIGALPLAPLAMPKQRLERPPQTARGLLGRLIGQGRGAPGLGAGLGRSGG